jgi:hypothetical protein
LTKVTKAEADAYNRWRTGYQQNWSQLLNPIAVRFSIEPQRLGAEVCVTPPIAAFEFRQFAAATSGAAISPGAGDPHPEALLHLAVAINSQSEPIKEAVNFLGGFNPTVKANPLAWMGQCVAIYADQDPFWAELAKAGNGVDFLHKNYSRLPVALNCEVKNPLAFALFVIAARAFAEQAAPRRTYWEDLEHNGQAYVKITVRRQPGEDGAATNVCAYYAVTANSLVATLNEPVLKRALDRQSARLAGTTATAPAASATEPRDVVERVPTANSVPANSWLGTNVCLRIDEAFMPTLEALFRDEFRPAQQRLAWSNLPILNEWKRRYPGQDPVAVHERVWHTKLVCPGGGRYIWNEQWQTMESTVYGHPGEPKPGPEKIIPVANITSANLGLTFDKGCLSGNVVLERKAVQMVR